MGLCRLAGVHHRQALHKKPRNWVQSHVSPSGMGGYVAWRVFITRQAVSGNFPKTQNLRVDSKGKHVIHIIYYAINHNNITLRVQLP